MLNLTNLKAVILDLDGTLADSAPDLAFALNHTLSTINLPPHSLEDVRNMIGGGIPKLIERGLRAHGHDASEKVLEKLRPEMLEFYGANATRETYIYPGGEELVRYLKSQDLATAICTNKNTEISNIILEKFNLTDAFDIVIGGSSGFPKKPDPSALNHIMSEVGSTPDTTVMIGDSGVDVGAARNANLRGVAVIRDGYTSVPAHDLGADHVFENFTELLEDFKAGQTSTAPA